MNKIELRVKIAIIWLNNFQLNNFMDGRLLKPQHGLPKKQNKTIKQLLAFITWALPVVLRHTKLFSLFNVDIAYA